MPSYQFYQPFSGVVRHLIIINVIMFMASLVAGSYSRDGLGMLAAYLPGSANFQPYQMATHMFMHGNLMHLAFNMLSLYFFGPMVEMAWGHRRFLFFYLFCGVGAYLLHMGVQWWELEQMGVDPRMFNGAMLGASGAVFGVYVAFAYLFPNQVISLLFPPISLKAKYFVVILAVIELFSGFSGRSTGIAHFAHLGGALAGFILIMVWYRGRLR